MTSIEKILRKRNIEHRNKEIHDTTTPSKVSKLSNDTFVVISTSPENTKFRDKVLAQDGREFFPCRYCSRAFTERFKRNQHDEICPAKTYILSTNKSSSKVEQANQQNRHVPNSTNILLVSDDNDNVQKLQNGAINNKVCSRLSPRKKTNFSEHPKSNSNITIINLGSTKDTKRKANKTSEVYECITHIDDNHEGINPPLKLTLKNPHSNKTNSTKTKKLTTTDNNNLPNYYEKRIVESPIVDHYNIDLEDVNSPENTVINLSDCEDTIEIEIDEDEVKKLKEQNISLDLTLFEDNVDDIFIDDYEEEEGEQISQPVIQETHSNTQILNKRKDLPDLYPIYDLDSDDEPVLLNELPKDLKNNEELVVPPKLQNEVVQKPLPDLIEISETTLKQNKQQSSSKTNLLDSVKTTTKVSPPKERSVDSKYIYAKDLKNIIPDWNKKVTRSSLKQKKPEPSTTKNKSSKRSSNVPTNVTQSHTNLEYKTKKSTRTNFDSSANKHIEECEIISSTLWTDKDVPSTSKQNSVSLKQKEEKEIKSKSQEKVSLTKRQLLSVESKSTPNSNKDIKLNKTKQVLLKDTEKETTQIETKSIIEVKDSPKSIKDVDQIDLTSNTKDSPQSITNTDKIDLTEITPITSKVGDSSQSIKDTDQIDLTEITHSTSKVKDSSQSVKNTDQIDLTEIIHTDDVKEDLEIIIAKETTTTQTSCDEEKLEQKIDLLIVDDIRINETVNIEQPLVLETKLENCDTNIITDQEINNEVKQSPNIDNKELKEMVDKIYEFNEDSDLESNVIEMSHNKKLYQPKAIERTKTVYKSKTLKLIEEPADKSTEKTNKGNVCETSKMIKPSIQQIDSPILSADEDTTSKTLKPSVQETNTPNLSADKEIETSKKLKSFIQEIENPNPFANEETGKQIVQTDITKELKENKITEAKSIEHSKLENSTELKSSKSKLINRTKLKAKQRKLAAIRKRKILMRKRKLIKDVIVKSTTPDWKVTTFKTTLNTSLEYDETSKNKRKVSVLQLEESNEKEIIKKKPKIIKRKDQNDSEILIQIDDETASEKPDKYLTKPIDGIIKPNLSIKTVEDNNNQFSGVNTFIKTTTKQKEELENIKTRQLRENTQENTAQSQELPKNIEEKIKAGQHSDLQLEHTAGSSKTALKKTNKKNMPLESLKTTTKKTSQKNIKEKMPVGTTAKKSSQKNIDKKMPVSKKLSNNLSISKEAVDLVSHDVITTSKLRQKTITNTNASIENSIKKIVEIEKKRILGSNDKRLKINKAKENSNNVPEDIILDTEPQKLVANEASTSQQILSSKNLNNEKQNNLKKIENCNSNNTDTNRKVDVKMRSLRNEKTVEDDVAKNTNIKRQNKLKNKKNLNDSKASEDIIVSNVRQIKEKVDNKLINKELEKNKKLNSTTESINEESKVVKTEKPVVQSFVEIIDLVATGAIWVETEVKIENEQKNNDIAKSTNVRGRAKKLSKSEDSSPNRLSTSPTKLRQQKITDILLPKKSANKGSVKKCDSPDATTELPNNKKKTVSDKKLKKASPKTKQQEFETKRKKIKKTQQSLEQTLKEVKDLEMELANRHGIFNKLSKTKNKKIVSKSKEVLQCNVQRKEKAQQVSNDDQRTSDLFDKLKMSTDKTPVKSKLSKENIDNLQSNKLNKQNNETPNKDVEQSDRTNIEPSKPEEIIQKEKEKNTEVCPTEIYIKNDNGKDMNKQLKEIIKQPIVLLNNNNNETKSVCDITSKQNEQKEIINILDNNDSDDMIQIKKTNGANKQLNNYSKTQITTDSIKTEATTKFVPQSLPTNIMNKSQEISQPREIEQDFCSSKHKIEQSKEYHTPQKSYQDLVVEENKKLKQQLKLFTDNARTSEDLYININHQAQNIHSHMGMLQKNSNTVDIQNMDVIILQNDIIKPSSMKEVTIYRSPPPPSQRLSVMHSDVPSITITQIQVEPFDRLKAEEEILQRTCTKCAKVFTTIADYEGHLMNGHKYPKIMLPAEEVAKYYDVMDRTHCPLCGKEIHNTYKSVFVKHLKTHIDEVGFACRICGLKFRRVDAMRSHEKRHIVAPPVPPPPPPPQL